MFIFCFSFQWQNLTDNKCNIRSNRNHERMCRYCAFRVQKKVWHHRDANSVQKSSAKTNWQSREQLFIVKFNILTKMFEEHFSSAALFKYLNKYLNCRIPNRLLNSVKYFYSTFKGAQHLLRAVNALGIPRCSVNIALKWANPGLFLFIFVRFTGQI